MEALFLLFCILIVIVIVGLLWPTIEIFLYQIFPAFAAILAAGAILQSLC